MKAQRILPLIITALLLFGIAAAAHAQIKIADTEDTKLYITIATVGTFQTLEQKNVYDAKGVEMPSLTSGMQTAFGDLGFAGKFGKKEEVEMYFDLYLASRNHPSTTYGNQGYLILHGVPENLTSLHNLLNPVLSRVDIKAGAFLLDFGDHLLHRSNNAITQLNPLVGNFVIDPELVSIGGEVMTKPGRFNALVGVSNGTNTEDFTPGRGLGYNAKVWMYPVKPLRTSLSVFRADHSDSTSSRAALFAGNRGGERYGAVLGGGQAPGQLLPGAGKNMTAVQFDATWDAPTIPLKLYGNYGMTKDKDLNGPAAGHPEESWKYYAADVVYKLTSSIYGAARYSAGNADKLNDASSNGKVRRIQIGGGLWLTKNALVKVEWVDQQYSGFAVGDVVNNGVAAWRDPAFRGIVSEFSFAF
jgi:hypothetical protein